jgi:Thioesterase superfamily
VSIQQVLAAGAAVAPTPSATVSLSMSLIPHDCLQSKGDDRQGQNVGDTPCRRTCGHRRRLHITFLQPVHVGDTVCCYTDVKRIGRTSITLGVEVWVRRQGQGERVKVTDAEFTFVAVDEDGRPRALAGSSIKGARAPGVSRRHMRPQQRGAM